MYVKELQIDTKKGAAKYATPFHQKPNTSTQKL